MRPYLQTTLVTALFLLLSSPFSSANSEIYRVIKKDGSVVYTDDPAPNENAKAVQLKPTRIVSPLSLYDHSMTEPSEQNEYVALTITSPEEKENIQNPAEIRVTTRVVPDLLADHKIQLLNNGKEIEANTSGTFILKEPHRGEYILTAKIVDQGNNVLYSSAPRTFYVFRHSILHRPPSTTPNP